MQAKSQQVQDEKHAWHQHALRWCQANVAGSEATNISNTNGAKGEGECEECEKANIKMHPDLHV